MASANFRLGHSAVSDSGPWTWGAYGGPIDVVASEWVKVELESTAGIATIAVTIPRADETVLAAGVPTVTIDQVTRTAVFQVGTDPATYCVEVVGNPSSTNPTTAVALAAHIPTANGLKLLALDESTESSATYKWLAKINNLLRIGPELPAGTDGQILTYDGGWTAKSYIEFPAGAARSVSVATPAIGNGDSLTLSSASCAAGGGDGGDAALHAAAGGAGDNDGAVQLLVDTVVMFKATTDIHGGSGVLYGIGGKFAVRPTVNWVVGTDAKLVELLEGLVSVGVIDGELLIA